MFLYLCFLCLLLLFINCLIHFLTLPIFIIDLTLKKLRKTTPLQINTLFTMKTYCKSLKKEKLISAK